MSAPNPSPLQALAMACVCLFFLLGTNHACAVTSERFVEIGVLWHPLVSGLVCLAALLLAARFLRGRYLVIASCVIAFSAASIAWFWKVLFDGIGV